MVVLTHIQTQLDFQPCGRRAVIAKFDHEQINSNGGAPLLRETDKRTGLIRHLAECFIDYRIPPGQRSLAWRWVMKVSTTMNACAKIW